MSSLPCARARGWGGEARPAGSWAPFIIARADRMMEIIGNKELIGWQYTDHSGKQFTLAPEKVDWFLSRALHPELIPEWDQGPRGTVGVIGEVGKLEALSLVFIGG